jgi:hypothetical protein
MHRRPVARLTILFILAGARGSGQEVLLQDTFCGEDLDGDRWVLTKDGDFGEAVVDLVDGPPDHAGSGRRLRLRAATLGTSPEMKYLGIRTNRPIGLADPVTIACDIDWNDQRNGSYLAAAIYLCPTASENPRKEPSWLAFEYTGVPPGRGVRTNVWLAANGSLRALHEDWGPIRADGRPVGRTLAARPHRVELILADTTLTVMEDGAVLCSAADFALPWTSAFVYLQLSSGTNYPAREVYFDNFRAVVDVDRRPNETGSSRVSIAREPPHACAPTQNASRRTIPNPAAAAGRCVSTGPGTCPRPPGRVTITPGCCWIGAVRPTGAGPKN